MATKPQVQCNGNSLTLGTGATGGLTYPNQLATLLTAGWDVSNQGVGGDTTQDLIDRGLDSWFDAGRAANVIVLWEITNDVKLNEDAAGAYSRVITWCGDSRAAGFKVIVATCIDRSESLPGAWETNRQAVNANIRENWASFADGIVDLGLAPHLGPAGSALDPTYFDDGVHLTNTGYAIVAKMVYDAVVALETIYLAKTLPGGTTYQPEVFTQNYFGVIDDILYSPPLVFVQANPSGAGAASGAGSAVGVGGTNIGSVGAASGVGSASAVGTSGTNSAAGVGIALAVGASLAAAVGNAAGVGTAQSNGQTASKDVTEKFLLVTTGRLVNARRHGVN